MAIKIYFRRFVALLLCCLLVFCSLPVQVHASDPVTAASLAIAGGQLAGAGLSGEAALSLAGPVGAVVGVTLGALGVNAYVSKAAQEAGKTRTRFVLDKLVIWGAQAGYTQEQLYSKIAEGISVAADGTIQLANDVAQTIQQFGNWLFTQEGEVVPSLSSGATQQMIYGDFSVKTFTTSQGPIQSGANGRVTTTFACTSGGPAFLLRYDNGAFTIASFTANTVCTYINHYENSDYTETRQPLTNYSYTNQSGEILYFNNSFLDSSAVNLLPSDYFLSYSEFLTSFRNSGLSPSFSDVSASDEVFVGHEQDWTDNKDVLNPSADDTPITLNPDLLNPIIDSLADGQQATMSIIDYLQALQDAWDHALDDVQTAIGTITDSLTGIQEQIAIPQTAVENPTITNPSVTPETTPVLDPSTVDPGTVVTGLSFDLTQIFPFCIPFDIYDMLSTLSATPEAPVYHVHYEGPYNILIDFTVDLSPWDSVAAVLRTVELLAFCIGLAYVTRSMFIRS